MEKKQKRIVEDFKKLILEMNNGIPVYKFSPVVGKIIPDNEILDYLLKKDVLIKSREKNIEGKEQYFLGIHGMNLANSYEIEKLSHKTKELTERMTGLTVIMAVLTLSIFIIEILSYEVKNIFGNIFLGIGILAAFVMLWGIWKFVK